MLSGDVMIADSKDASILGALGYSLVSFIVVIFY